MNLPSNIQRCKHRPVSNRTNIPNSKLKNLLKQAFLILLSPLIFFHELRIMCICVFTYISYPESMEFIPLANHGFKSRILFSTLVLLHLQHLKNSEQYFYSHFIYTEKEFTIILVQWLRLALSKGPNRVGVFFPPPLLPEDGNRSSFRNVVFLQTPDDG
jgi:hypothetical protein